MPFTLLQRCYRSLYIRNTSCVFHRWEVFAAAVVQVRWMDEWMDGTVDGHTVGRRGVQDGWMNGENEWKSDILQETDWMNLYQNRTNRDLSAILDCRKICGFINYSWILADNHDVVDLGNCRFLLFCSWRCCSMMSHVILCSFSTSHVN